MSVDRNGKINVDKTRLLNSILSERNTLFLGSTAIGKLPSTKLRDSYKRRRIIAIEMGILAKKDHSLRFKRVKEDFSDGNDKDIRKSAEPAGTLQGNR